HHYSDLSGKVLGRVDRIAVTPGTGHDAIGWQGRVGPTVRAEKADRAPALEQKIRWQDKIGSRRASRISCRRSDEEGMIGGVPRQIALNVERMGCAPAGRRYCNLLATDEVLTANRTEELDELQRTAGIAVNLANVPKMEGGLCRSCHGRCGYSNDGTANQTARGQVGTMNEFRGRVFWVHECDFPCLRYREQPNA